MITSTVDPSKLVKESAIYALESSELGGYSASTLIRDIREVIENRLRLTPEQLGSDDQHMRDQARVEAWEAIAAADQLVDALSELATQ